tara:strand:- start:12746 stop:14389 length:1644 start_codon:yes stop_codon:yes gene_type:complete
MINSTKVINCNFKNIHLFTNYLKYDLDCLNCSLVKERIEKTGILKNIIFLYIFLLNKLTFLQKILRNNSLNKFIYGLIILLYESKITESDLTSINNKRQNDQREFKPSEIFDVIIVGSGPGGSLAANELTNKYPKVLLIESGDNFNQEAVKHHSYLQTKFQFKNEGMTFCLGNIPMIYAEGSTLGGGSEVNSGLYFKLVDPYKTKLLEACNLDIEEWSIAEKEIEYSLSVQNDPNFDINSSNSVLHIGSLKNDLYSNEIPRWKKYKPLEEHQSMQVTYIKDALEKGLKIITGCTVTKIDNSKKEFISIYAVNSNNEIIEYKSKKVVLSGGTVGTPKILKKSRLIKGKVNFNFHPMFRMVAENKKEKNTGDLFPPIQSWTKDKVHKFGYSVSTYPYIKATLASLGHINVKNDYKNLACFFSTTTLENSKGRLIFAKNNTIPFIYIKKKDREKIKEGFKLLHKILDKGGATKIWPKSPNKLSPMTTVHLFSSLPISKNDQIGENGELKSDSRIKISDGSILPVAPWGNPQAVIMALNLILMRKWMNKFE